MEQSVPTLSIVFACLSAAMAIFVPLALAMWCARKRKGAFRSVIVGMACFLLGALVLENLLHSVVFTLVPTLRQTPVAYTLYAALAAGLFEETARLVGLRILCKKDSDVMTGFAYGVGHGGFEALYIGFAGLVGNVITMLAINSGQISGMLQGLTGEQLAAAQAQLSALCTMAPITFLAGGLERLVALCFHLALSMVIWMVVTKRLPKWGYAAAVGLHAGLDVFAALYQVGVLTSIWMVELLVTGFTAAVCFGVIQVLKAKGVACPAKQ